LEEEVNDKNVYNLYAAAYALRCDKLLEDLVDHMVKLLTLNNVVHFYELSIEFDITKLKLECFPGMVQNFRDIPNTLRPDFLCGLPISEFIKLLSSDELYV
jgi:hypothetical protein